MYIETYSGTNENLDMNTKEKKTEAGGNTSKSTVLIQDISTDSVIEVNIGNEHDFPEEMETERKLTSGWKTRGEKQTSQCEEWNVCYPCRGKRAHKSVRSEVTSIDVVLPSDIHEDGRNDVKLQKAMNKKYKKSSVGGLRSEEACKPDPSIVCGTFTHKTQSRDDSGVVQYGRFKHLNARLLILCGKNSKDNFTEDDLALLQEMKKQIGHKEGLEKLLSEVRESTLAERESEKRPEKKDESANKDLGANENLTYFMGKGDTNIKSKFLRRNRQGGEERKYLEEIRKHSENKKLSLQQTKTAEESPDSEKRMRISSQKAKEAHGVKERRNKLRHSDYSVIEKAVTDTIRKFIELDRFQIPQDTVNIMKKNIIQSLQSEYTVTSESKRNSDNVLATEENLKSGTRDNSIRSVSAERREERANVSGSRNTVLRYLEAAAEPIARRDSSSGADEVKTVFTSCDAGLQEKSVEKENATDLLKELETWLNSIRAQTDMTGMRLRNIVLEKTEFDESASKKLRIMHDFYNGVTDTMILNDEKMRMGSPEGDNVNTMVCNCWRSTVADEKRIKVTCNQWSQTAERICVRSETQTDFAGIRKEEAKSGDAISERYRIMETNDTGELYRCPEVVDNTVEAETNRTVTEACETVGNDVFREMLRFASRETFISEKDIPISHDGSLRRTIKSDCLGLNSLNYDELKSKSSLLKLLTDNLNANGKPVEEHEKKVVEEKKSVEVHVVREKESEARLQEERTVSSESYHMGCMWLWNGKKMDSGVDLKIRVEDLLREKLKEILNEVAVDKSRPVKESEEVGTSYLGSSDKNLDIRKIDAKFCMIKGGTIAPDAKPFIFNGVSSDTCQGQIPLGNEVSEKDAAEQEEGELSSPEKTVREVGTQDSRHIIVSSNRTKLKPRSKLCTVAKLAKQRMRKCGNERSKNESADVGSARKVKLEFKKWNPSNEERKGHLESVRESCSVVSNGSSSSAEDPVRIKLIGIEVSKENSPGEERTSGCSPEDSETGRFSGEDLPAKGLPRKFKHWELIENVLNRVSQKEKDRLWNDIREFVKKKIGRDIDDEGAREVCIEIEQDVSKFARGRWNCAAVARGNYSRNEGDVEVEVDLTLEELERILRHRQKLRRRQHFEARIVESQTFSSTSVASDGATGRRSPNSEGHVKMAKENN